MLRTLFAMALAVLAPSALAQPATAPLRVTPDNFIRAETDRYFVGIAQGRQGFGRFSHDREPFALDRQTVIRMNRDTLYSAAVFDLDAGPVTITLPEPPQRVVNMQIQRRFVSMQVISQDHYTIGVHYGAGRRQLTRQQVGTRYVMVAIRTLFDPSQPQDLARVHAFQDGIRVEQRNGPGRFEIPSWDKESQDKVREHLLGLAATLPDSHRMFGSRAQVDPVRHLIGSASAWGGNPEREALYLSVVPERNDGTTIHRLEVGHVPVDGFWSISVYNADGFFQANPQNAYSLNNMTARRDGDGSVRVQFGGCDGQVPNCLPITPGWNYLVRLYRPRPEVLNGQWRFPAARPAG